MTFMLADMLKSSLSNFASQPISSSEDQLKSSSEGQGESTQNVTSDQGKEPLDHDDRSEDGLASVEDPAEIPGDPKLESLMMTGGGVKRF